MERLAGCRTPLRSSRTLGWPDSRQSPRHDNYASRGFRSYKGRGGDQTALELIPTRLASLADPPFQGEVTESVAILRFNLTPSVSSWLTGRPGGDFSPLIPSAAPAF